MPRDPALLERDFPGNPNPVPQAPDIRASPAATPAPAGGDVNVETTGGAQMTAPTPADLTPKRLYTVTDLGKDGLGVSMYDEQHGTSDLGTVNIQDAHAVLDASGGSYNPVMKTWNVPEETATTLLSGRLSYPEYLIKRFEHGEAGAIESLNGQKFLIGMKDAKSTLEDSDLEMLKARVLENPAIAWNGSFGQLVGDILKHPAETFRQATGGGAEMLPNVIGALKASVVGGGIGGLWGAAAAAASGGAALPAVAPAAGVGAARARLGYFIKTEAGSTAVELLRKGRDEKTVRAIAPIAGIIKGTLDSVGFDLLTASTQRTILKGVLGSAPVKAAMGKALEFGSGVAGDTVTQVLNTITSQLAEDTAADVESVGPNGKPRVFVPARLRAQEIKDTILNTVMVAGTMKAADIAAGKLGERVKTAAKGKEAPKAIEGVAPAAAPKAPPAPLPGDKPAGAQEMTAPKEAPAPAEEATPTPEMPTTAAGALEHGTPEQAADYNALVEPPLPPEAGPPTLYTNPLGAPKQFLDPPLISEWDKFTPKPHLIEKSPFHAAVVLDLRVPQIQQATIANAIILKSQEFATAAWGSRERSLTDRAAQVMPEVFDYLNAQNEEAASAALAKLTGKERRYAEFMQSFLRDHARPYLKTEEAMRSRFEGEKNYFPNVPKGAWEEVLKNDDGLWAGVKAAWTRAREVDVDLTAGDGMNERAFFRYALFRSGEVEPSRNVQRVFENYVRTLSTKIALDQALPPLLNKIEAYRQLTDLSDPNVRQAHAEAQTFLAQYVNALKGHSILQEVIPRGGTIDTAIRGGMSYMAWLSIAFRPILQGASLAGEVAGVTPAIGLQGLAKGEYRLRLESEQSRAILSKYENFVGEGVWKSIWSAPGRDLGERSRILPYALIAAWASHVKRVALLSQMTDAEFKAGEISPARLAGLSVELGRWIPGFDNKSIVGGASAASAVNQFKSWAVPTLFTAKDLFSSTLKSLTEGQPLSEMKKKELLNGAVGFGVAAAIYLAASHGESDYDKKHRGPAEKKLVSEMFSHLGALSPTMFLSTPRLASWLFHMAQYSTQLLTPYAHGATATHGKYKGVEGMKRENTPAFWKELMGDSRRRR